MSIKIEFTPEELDILRELLAVKRRQVYILAKTTNGELAKELWEKYRHIGRMQKELPLL